MTVAMPSRVANVATGTKPPLIVCQCVARPARRKKYAPPRYAAPRIIAVDHVDALYTQLSREECRSTVTPRPADVGARVAALHDPGGARGQVLRPVVRLLHAPGLPTFSSTVAIVIARPIRPGVHGSQKKAVIGLLINRRPPAASTASWASAALYACAPPGTR